jgi:hypothetical protein
VWERGHGCVFWDVMMICLLVRVFDVQYVYRDLDKGRLVVGLSRLYKRPSNFNVQYLLTITSDLDNTLWCTCQLQ